ncbi:pyridoxal phosphate-dependent decarboxylase family protein [Aureliella helgolandensis]|uniref:L-2,4-diaminobutyrate decarboxylase n=1 Tax=Aureliella helgolandensis TaxID=2527968 RepID=A0A518G025_9BACT|nr:pyridoxal-dependent decarboxylase [Aureliella helgolandensis]QDV21962.1 L-2,4-diaminobutyrate decarboxylase [Aureliella helgolandensis]
MNPLLREAYSTDAFRKSAHRLIDQICDHLAASFAGEHQQALPWQAPENAQRFWRDLAQQSPTIEEVCQHILDRSVRISDPKYMGHQICVPAPTAILAGMVTEALNNGSGVFEMGMAGTAMESHVVQVVARRLGWDEAADGYLTSGGTLANLTALLAARACRRLHSDALDGPSHSTSASPTSDWEHGTRQRLAVMVSEQAHYCVDRAARVMGWGAAGIIRVPTNPAFQMDTEQLPRLYAQATEDGLTVVAIVGSACSTSTGAYDDLQAIADFAAEQRLWFHVDGAHGAAVAFSDRHRGMLAGIERADSVVIDFHKMLLTPVLCSALVFRCGADSYRTFATEAEYLFSQQEENESVAAAESFNLARRTFECTKTMMAAKIYSLLAVHGEQLLEASVDHLHALASQFAAVIESRREFELAVQPQSNIVCFRYHGRGETTDKSSRSVEAAVALSQRMTLVRQALTEQGKFYIVKTVLRGEVWLRCTIANPFTSADEFNALLDEVERLTETLRPSLTERV